MEVKNYNKRFKEILEELKNLGCDTDGINRLEKSIREANSLGQQHKLEIFQNNTRQTIQKRLTPLLANIDKPKKRIDLFTETVSDFKQDLTEHLDREKIHENV
jgi:hypothetical protein